jgi:hypothetical protein
MYLPTVTDAWEYFIKESESKYLELQREIEDELNRAIENAMNMYKIDAHRDDPWLSRLDWTVKPTRMVPAKVSKSGKITPARPFKGTNMLLEGKPKWLRGIAGLHRLVGPPAQTLSGKSSKKGGAISAANGMERISPKL